MHLAGKVTSDIIEKINSGIGEMIHQNMVLRLTVYLTKVVFGFFLCFLGFWQRLIHLG